MNTSPAKITARSQNSLAWNEVEHAIMAAHYKVEFEGPAHPLLTEAGLLMIEARQKIAEWCELHPDHEWAKAINKPYLSHLAKGGTDAKA